MFDEKMFRYFLSSQLFITLLPYKLNKILKLVGHGGSNNILTTMYS